MLTRGPFDVFRVPLTRSRALSFSLSRGPSDMHRAIGNVQGPFNLLERALVALKNLWSALNSSETRLRLVFYP